MQYKTIVHEMLMQRPNLLGQLQVQHLLPATLERYTQMLKANHEAWMDRLKVSHPNSDPSQIASEALEYALQELTEALPSESQEDESEPLSLGAAMAFIRRTPRG